MSGGVSVAALIPAAGEGTRLGLGPKAFVEVGGRSLLARAVEALAPHVDEVVVALPGGTSFVGARVVGGGPTRQATVRALLDATDAEFVLIHDAARPFLSPSVIARVLAAAREAGAATAALPVADTLVRGAAGGREGVGREGMIWEGIVPREGIWAVQTPQGFHRDLLREAHAAAERDGYQATDDAGLVARLGREVRLVEGDARLFKVTAPGDLALAEALAPTWGAGA